MSEADYCEGGERDIDLDFERATQAPTDLYATTRSSFPFGRCDGVIIAAYQFAVKVLREQVFAVNDSDSTVTLDIRGEFSPEDT